MPKMIKVPYHNCTFLLDAYLEQTRIAREPGIELMCDCGAVWELIVHPKAAELGISYADASRVWRKYE